MTYLSTNYSVTVTKNCKKNRACSCEVMFKTKCITFFLNTVYRILTGSDTLPDKRNHRLVRNIFWHPRTSALSMATRRGTGYYRHSVLYYEFSLAPPSFVNIHHVAPWRRLKLFPSPKTRLSPTKRSKSTAHWFTWRPLLNAITTDGLKNDISTQRSTAFVQVSLAQTSC